eukprot:CAMPEP_0185597236 /NCGR_PEP_ID=MMETSP0434-20130131/81239_1 /TAXON_ID=626734 ORGANISM="Favella taraikaensis, Strain Fe Narragansett Bay" /NCGR_SAMPLE_ID=MMETSP0434 /ASSEMBLY_ACC=CAM_ASM_000379 /LENGTH=69 /DNA_ID=CAMNT_0028225907 /DNA_START=259 /DNA_END=468 /DNA_ORIENTATION=-
MSFDGFQRQASTGGNSDEFSGKGIEHNSGVTIDRNSDEFSGKGIEHNSGVTIDRSSGQVVGWDTIFSMF